MEVTEAKRGTHRTGLVTQSPLPARPAAAASVSRAALGPVSTETGRVTAGAPGARRTGHRAVLPPPACTQTGRQVERQVERQRDSQVERQEADR